MSINLNKLERLNCDIMWFDEAIQYYDLDEPVTVIRHETERRGTLKELLEEHPDYRHCLLLGVYKEHEGNAVIELE